MTWKLPSKHRTIRKNQITNDKKQTNYKFQYLIKVVWVMALYDLEERTLQFAAQTRIFVKQLPRTVSNFEDVKQLIRSSGSVCANYIEANEALSKRDFIMRIRISRKEAKESRAWLQLVYVGLDRNLEEQRQKLANEATELIKIFSSILAKSGAKNWKNSEV